MIHYLQFSFSFSSHLSLFYQSTFTIYRAPDTSIASPPLLLIYTQANLPITHHARCPEIRKWKCHFSSFFLSTFSSFLPPFLHLIYSSSPTATTQTKTKGHSRNPAKDHTNPRAAVSSTGTNYQLRTEAEEYSSFSSWVRSGYKYESNASLGG